MKRWTPHLLTGLTVLLLAVWLVSGWAYAVWFSPPSSNGHGWCAAIAHGLVGAGVTDDPDPPGLDVGTDRFDLVLLPDLRWSAGDRLIAVPILWLAIVSGLLAVGAWCEVWTDRRKPGACRTCGYDLTGLPPAEGMQPRTCPECGT